MEPLCCDAGDISASAHFFNPQNCRRKKKCDPGLEIILDCIWVKQSTAGRDGFVWIKCVAV